MTTNLDCGSSGGGAAAPRGRVRGRRGRAAGGGGSGGHKLGRRRSPTQKNGRNRRSNTGGGIKARRRRGDGSDVDASDRDCAAGVVPGRSRRRRGDDSALDVTRDVLERRGGEYPELAPRRGGRGSGAVTAAGEGISRDSLEGGRTDRVVTMLAALEEVVMGVCKVRGSYFYFLGRFRSGMLIVFSKAK